MTRSERAAELVRRLPAIYPDAHCELMFSNALQLLAATILSAQCTDVRVNLTTPALFARCPTARDLAEIPEEELEALIRSTGFYRAKARSLRGMAAELVAHHDGRGAARDGSVAARCRASGRKTANVVLGNAFGIDEGVVVDTHVGRLSQRLGLTKQTDPEKIEHGLMKLIPRGVIGRCGATGSSSTAGGAARRATRIATAANCTTSARRLSAMGRRKRSVRQGRAERPSYPLNRRTRAGRCRCPDPANR